MSDADTGAFRADGFGRKVGPFPIWGWALLLVAAVYIFHRFYSGAASSTSSPVTNPYGSGGTTGADLSTAPYQGNSGANGTGVPAFASNDAYNQAAIGEAGQFGSNALAVQGALQQYESGGNLTSEQGSLIDQIVASLGGLPSTPASTSQIVDAPTYSTYQSQAANLLDTAFGGNFTDATAKLGGNVSGTRQQAINTWANALQAGMTQSQALAQIQSGPTYTNYRKNGGR